MLPKSNPDKEVRILLVDNIKLVKPNMPFISPSYHRRLIGSGVKVSGKASLPLCAHSTPSYSPFSGTQAPRTPLRVAAVAPL